MSAVTFLGRAGDDSASLAADVTVRRFEAAWRDSRPGHRPDFRDFLSADSPAERLALARTDLALRWEAGERVQVERYADLALPDEQRVALVYEEFCLREEAGDNPAPSDFYARFPEIAPALRRVFDIHDLVGSAPETSTASFSPGRPGLAPPFPEAGQTIAGFHLVEELGRGGFARVFLARERQLGDRPVALKVARSGSREPQTLARLQHTHIVPVHSYRIDPATGLHLLCMPYFGRVTLAHVLADKGVRDAIWGAEIVQAIDRLGAGRDGVKPPERATGRIALESRPYARAVAWWGARLAEALQHAHDRGVLHRDVKPSNVLITADGMPMLLDFNLAHDPIDAKAGPEAALGGTVAYMPPEHLEALAEGRGDGGDGRSDIYALGVVLFEAMGARPFGPPPTSRSVPEALLRAAEVRRERPPRLQDRFPEAPAALCAVVARCLAPDPEARYASAAELAEDLQAVADDLPLRHAREPIAIRLIAKVRRHQRAMAATATVLIALALAGFWGYAAHVAGESERKAIQATIENGHVAFENHNFDRAREFYRAAEDLCGTSPHLTDLRARAHRQVLVTLGAEKSEEQAAAFLRGARPLRLALLGLDDSAPPKAPDVTSALGPFFVLENADWMGRDDLAALRDDQLRDLVREVHRVLFLAAARAARSRDPDRQREALALCDKARALRTSARRNPRLSDADPALPEGPWEALRAIVAARLAGQAPPAACSPPFGSVGDAWVASCWSQVLMAGAQGVSKESVAWAIRASRLDPGNFELELEAAARADQAGLHDTAFEHYNAAVDLAPDAARPRAGRARLLRAQKGQWGRAREDLDRALAVAPGMRDARLERGLVAQSLGDLATARADYQVLIADARAGPYRLAAAQNLAKIDADAGRIAPAFATLDDLLEANPDDPTARLARALLHLRSGSAARAEWDLSAVLRTMPNSPDALALRALCRLALDRPEAAEADAERAARLAPSPRRERLRARTALALRRYDALSFDDPEIVRLLPSAGPRLPEDLRAAAEALGRGHPSPAARSTRAVILCALGEEAAAESEATRAIEAAPLSPRARLVRGRIRRLRGDREGALRDARDGLAIEPDDPRLLGLAGLLRVESGEAASALADLESAARRGAGGPALDRPIAEARTRLGYGRKALEDWNRTVAHDPDDPTLRLGRARAFLAFGQVDSALADLEAAADGADGRGDVLAAVATTYARCLPARPDRAWRVLALTRKALAVGHPGAAGRGG